jgi:hypothetical protein
MSQSSDDTIEKPSPAVTPAERAARLTAYRELHGVPPGLALELLQALDEEAAAESADIAKKIWPKPITDEVKGVVVKAKKERNTRSLPTKVIKQRIAAAGELGLRVTGILPDGTVTFDGAVSQNATQDDPKELRRLL